MPLRRQVDTLKQICIARIMKTLSYYTTNELHDIPPELLEELNQGLYDVVQESRDSYGDAYKVYDVHNFDHPNDEIYYNMNRLVKKNMKKMNVFFPSFRFNYETTIFNRLTSLTCIFHDEKNDVDDGQKEFLHLIPFIPNVVSLKLDDLNDDNLEAIGDHCPKLENLILDNPSITDDGIRRLCQSKSGGSKIKTFKFRLTKVTAEGCLIALTNLKQLKVFRCDHLADAFTKLFDDFVLKGSPIPTFQLVHVPSNLMIRKGILRFLTKCCPNIEKLTFPTHTDLTGLMDELRNCNLTNFELILDKIQILTSDLNNIGSKVTTLALSQTLVDVETIKSCCPNLLNLVFAKVNFQPINITDRNCPFTFTKLDSLCLIGPIPLEHLKYLLANCLDLEKLIIAYNNELNDGELISILNEVNPLRCLRHFFIGYCNGISKKSILELLCRENELSELKILNCSNFTDVEYLEIKSYVKENNYSVRLIPKQCKLLNKLALSLNL